MPTLEEWLQTLSEVLDNPVNYASQLRGQAYDSPAGILAAGSAQELSKDCGLPIGAAKVIWRAAGGTTGRQHIIQLRHSLACTAVHRLVQSIMAPWGSSSNLGFIGQLCLSMEK